MLTRLILTLLLSLSSGFLWSQAPANDAARQEEVQTLVRLLQSDSPQHDKAQACERLAVIGDAEAVPALARLLPDEKLSAYARIGLESIPDPAAGEALREALGSLKGPLLSGVIQSIGVRRDEKATQDLIALLKDADPEIVAAAAMSLARLSSSPADKALCNALKEAKSGETQRSLAEACLLRSDQASSRGQINEAQEMVDALIKADLPQDLHLAATRARVMAGGSERVKSLIGLLKSDDPDEVGLGLMLARELPGAEMSEALAQELSGLSPDLQVLLMGVLIDRQDASVRKTFQEGLRSKSPQVRVAALNALAFLGDAPCIEPLLEAVQKDRSPEETSAALGSLRRLKAPETNAALCKALPSLEAKSRISLIKILADRNATEAVTDLLLQAEDQDQTVTEAAFESLGALAEPKDLGRLVALLIACPSEPGRDAAIRAVVAVAMKNPDRVHRARPIVEALNDSNPFPSQCALLRALGGIGNFEAFDALRSARATGDAQVQETCLRELSNWPDATPASLLLDWARAGADPVSRALALRGVVRMAGLVAETCDQPSPQVLAWLSQIHDLSESPEEKKLLLSGLSRMPSLSSLRMAESYLNDDRIRSEAAMAVIQIAQGLSAAGRSQEAKASLERTLASLQDPGMKTQVEAALQKLQSAVEFLTTWEICGPYREGQKQCQEVYNVVFPPETGGQADWRRGPESAPSNRVELSSVFPGNHCVAYARTRLLSDDERPARLEMGFDDGGKVWLNDQVVCEANTAGAFVLGSSKADITLRKGENVLFLKLTQHSGPWQFCVRAVGQDGLPLKGVQVVTGAIAEEETLTSVSDDPFEKISSISLFDGQTLKGWSGPEALFRVKEGAIVAGQLDAPIVHSAYLCSEKEFGNFEMTLQVRTEGQGTNSGVQFWSHPIPGSHEISGYQADVADNAYWGCLYDSNRGRIALQVSQKELSKIVRIQDWNEIRIRAKGDRLQVWLNGYQTVDWVETDPALPRRGFFGLQTHQGPPGEAWFRDIRVKTVE